MPLLWEGVAVNLLHRIIHGHWPEWEAVDYDFLTWRYRCCVCERLP